MNRFFSVLLVFGICWTATAQDDFNGPNAFLLGAPVWKCDTSTFAQDTLLVPQDYSSIQAAINACVNGDLILVAPGEYQENLAANGKEFGLASNYLLSCDTADIYNTVINGNGGTGLTIDLEEHIKVIGFTFTNCSSGIYFDGQNANWHYDLYFSNLRLVGNSSHGINGYLWRTGNYLINSHVANNGSHGIRMVNKGALYIGECLVENNGGHGIYNNQCGFIATSTKILNNNGDGIYSTYWGAGFTQHRCIIAGNGGDGIQSKNTGAQRVYNCTILNNGGYGLRGTVTARNSIVFDNAAGVHLVDNGGDPGSQATSTFEYMISDVLLPGTGNLEGDPMLADNFVPLATSPVFMAGSPVVINIGSYAPNGSNGYGSYALAAGMSLGAIQVTDIIEGCTELGSCNYNDEANVDDGSCVASGCMDAYACNYDAAAGCDDGSCDYSCCPGPGCCSEGMFWDWDSLACYVSKPADINMDGCVQLNDLLDLLSAYGDCAVAEWTCGDPLEYQGYDYATVQIGDQCWFAENLKALNYNNGEEIPLILDGQSWKNTTEGAVSYYNFAPSNYEAFGALYNWYVTIDSRSVCPTGWHVPSDGEFIDFETQLGMNSAEAQINYAWRGTDELIGLELKRDSTVYPGWDGNNNQNFCAIPAGQRVVLPNTEFKDLNTVWSMWTSSNCGNSAYSRHLVTSYNGIYRQCPGGGKKDGYSIRCIQD